MKVMVVSKDLCLQKYADVHETTCNQKKIVLQTKFKRNVHAFCSYVHVIGRKIPTSKNFKGNKSILKLLDLLIRQQNQIQNINCPTDKPIWKIIRNAEVGSIDKKGFKYSLSYLPWKLLEQLLSPQEWN